MKKLLALMLAAALALSLVACGGGGAGDSDTPSGGNGDTTSTDTPSGGGEDSIPPTDAETTPSEEEHDIENQIALNDTKTTENFEVTLTRVEFANSLTNIKNSEDYLLPATEGSTMTASSGKTFLMFEMELKFIGKEGGSMAIGGNTVSYGDGYTFSDYEAYVLENGTWELKFREESGNQTSYYITPEPLSDTIYTFRGYYELPIETRDNEDESLLMMVNIQGNHFNYIIR